jgi:hypothetical protein
MHTQVFGNLSVTSPSLLPFSFSSSLLCSLISYAEIVERNLLPSNKALYGFALQIDTATGLVKWPSPTDETIVEDPIVYTNITSYPELWQLYNETLKTHLAHPVGGKYLVYYNPVENTVFCDWEILVEELEQSTPTHSPEETPPEIPPMPRSLIR